MALPRPSIKQQVVAITVLGVALRLVGVRQSIWHDEANSILLARMGFGQMLAAIPRLEASPPVYYVLLWGWDHVFGFGALTSRLFGVVIGIPLVPVMYRTAAKLTASHRVGMTAAACAACSPLMVWYAQEVKPYGLLVLLTALTFLAFVRLTTQEPTRSSVALWALASVLALGTHFYAVFTIAPQAIWLLIRYRRRVDVLAGVVVIATCGLALIPMLRSEASNLGFLYITEVPRSTRLAQIIPQFLIGVSSPARTALKFACEGIALASILLLVLRGTTSERQAGRAMALLALGGLALAMLVALSRDSLLSRNLIGLWVPAALLITIGLSTTRNLTLGLGLTAALCAIGVAIVIAVAVNPSLQRADWAGVARVITPAPPGGRPASGRRLVVLENWLVLSPLQLYVPRLRPLKLPAKGTSIANVAEIDLVRALQSAPSGSAPCWWGTPCIPFPSPIPHPNRIPGFRVFERRRVQEFVVIRLRAVGHPRSVSVHALAAAISGLSVAANTYLSSPSLMP